MNGNVIVGNFGGNTPRATHPTRTQQLSQTATESVRTLLSVSPIPWVQELFVKLEQEKSPYIKFFQHFFRLRHVSIRSHIPEITLYAMMNVTDNDTGEEWEIGVDTFVRLLDIPPGAIDDNQLSGYLLDLMNSADINIVLRVNDTTEEIPEDILELSEAENFAPETLMAATWNGENIIHVYEIWMNKWDIESGAHTATDEYLEPNTLPVLYMMLKIYKEALSIDPSPATNIDVQISKESGGKLTTITMTFEDMCKEIDAAILRISPLYANYKSPARVRDMIYDRYVAERVIPIE